jgi:hypothetical protein
MCERERIVKRLLVLMLLTSAILTMFLGSSAFAVQAPSIIKSCTPKPGEVINDARPVITASFVSNVDTSTVVFKIDGKVIPSSLGNLSARSDSVSYLPIDKLSAGIHTIGITANTGSGSWSFTVKAPKLATTRTALKWVNKAVGLCEATYKTVNNGTGDANGVGAYGVTSKTAGVTVLTKNVYIANSIKPGHNATFKVRYYVPKISGTIYITVPVVCCDDGGNDY